MAGPAKQVMGEVIRPRFNVYTILDHALGHYEKGEDGLYYLNGGFSHIMGFAGRGNTFKSTLLDFCIFIIMLRYRAAWGSKYDTEVSAALQRAETGFTSARHAVGDASAIKSYDADRLLELIDSQNYNMVGADTLSGERYYSDYIRDEVEKRFKDYMSGRGVRDTVFIDPVRRKAKAILDPWLYSVDSLSEWHTSDIEDKYSKSDTGDSDQNILNAHDALQKSNMMGRWPVAMARGGMYMGFVAHLADDAGKAMSGTRGTKSNAKLLDDAKDDLKFAGIPRRQISFLTNSLIVATSSSECKEQNSYDAKAGVNGEKYPTARSRTMNASVNDLKEIVYTQFRAKGGHTGVKFKMIFSQEMGLLYHLSLWEYLSTTLSSDFGYTRSGANYELHLLPGFKFMRTTIRDLIDEAPRLRRALEITAAVAYMQNNYHTLDNKYRISPKELFELIDAKWDWNDILDNTVEYWTFKDQTDAGGKKCITAMTLLAMAVDDLEPKFLKRKTAKAAA